MSTVCRLPPVLVLVDWYENELNMRHVMEMENCSSRGEFKIFNRRAKKRINHPFKFVNSDGAKNVAKYTSEAFEGIFLMNGIWERRKEFRIKSPTTKFSLTKVRSPGPVTNNVRTRARTELEHYVRASGSAKTSNMNPKVITAGVHTQPIITLVG